MRRLLPTPATEVSSIRSQYEAERTRRADGRPWVGICMVSSLDGSIAVEGRSGALSNSDDTEVLRALRSLADLILVGAGTVRAEGYGAPKKLGQRIGVVTNRAEIDTSTELFTSGAGFLVCPRSAPAVDVETLRCGDDHVDLVEALGRLHEIAPDVVHVQAEGGAVLNGALVAADLVDELDLTISPHLAGGDGPRLTSGAPEVLRAFRPAHLLVGDDGFVFGRWVRR